MISQTVEYAFRAMSHLASVGDAAATSEEIARSTRVPRGYLSKVMRHLVRARLVRSYRGPRGGFTLAADPRLVTLLDIVNAVDPIRRIDGCPLDNPLHVTLCPLHRCLDDVLAHMEQTFRHVTVGSVLDGASQAGSCQSLFVPRCPGVPKEPL
ncbi:MAG: Rrf2 family transcriptional regulator [Phycisphaeraceae bacterium]|nr:Rrf2 family transcriptional regulator [Phycisphaerae bacterium]MBX3391693.1 Rrf2 family transcriptional regulator [Phycisphaeraceae bacterium]HRJ48962.1 Rrf2 family transcriptional regulator [Phycisphaerales bacterium]